MNSELAKQALAKVGNPNILINIVSRRVRQLTTGGGPSSRPLIAETAGMGAGDIALSEIIHEKVGWEMAMSETGEDSAPRKKRGKKA